MKKIINKLENICNNYRVEINKLDEYEFKVQFDNKYRAFGRQKIFRLTICLFKIELEISTYWWI
jgi:hypothetical protein